MYCLSFQLCLISSNANMSNISKHMPWREIPNSILCHYENKITALVKRLYHLALMRFLLLANLG